MTRLLSSLAFAAAIVAASGAFAQTAAPVQSATVNNVQVSGVAGTPASSGSPATGIDGQTNLLNNFTGAKPIMPTLTAPSATSPSKDCGTAGC